MTEKIILVLGSICICVFTTIAYSQADYVFENGYPSQANLLIIFSAGLFVGISITTVFSRLFYGDKT